MQQVHQHGIQSSSTLTAIVSGVAASFYPTPCTSYCWDHCWLGAVEESKEEEKITIERDIS